MSTYDYKCEGCGKEFAVYFSKISDREKATRFNEIKCPECGNKDKVSPVPVLVAVHGAG
jgi:putative FmdB family regulatory protein